MGITSYESQFMEILSNIYHDGYSDGVNERTGMATKRLPGQVIRVDVGAEFPILKSKFVAGKTAAREISWIWQKQSNNIHDLNASIWDEWADVNGSIEKAYGAQMKRPVNVFLDVLHKTPESFRSYRNQAEYVINYLKENPNGRWAIATLWNPSELSQMGLVPCCHTTTWNLDGGRLNCVLDQRSGDMGYGVPFNTTQYAELMILIARDLGVNPGILTHVIADAHIYDNQMEGVAKQIEMFYILENIACGDEIVARHTAADLTGSDDHYSKKVEELMETARRCVVFTPSFYVPEDEPTDFFKLDIEKCKVVNYESMGKIDFGDVVV